MATETSGKICNEFLDIKIVTDFEDYPEKFHLIESVTFLYDTVYCKPCGRIFVRICWSQYLLEFAAASPKNCNCLRRGMSKLRIQMTACCCLFSRLCPWPNSVLLIFSCRDITLRKEILKLPKCTLTNAVNLTK